MIAKKKSERRKYIHPSTGEVLPSVTEIIGRNLGWSKDALMAWSNKIGREGKTIAQGRDNSAKLGQCVHAIIESILSGDDRFHNEDGFTDSMIAMSQPNAERVVRALENNGLSAVLCEERFVDPELGYGGTLDLILKDANGALWICDIKTGNNVYDEVCVQLGAYERLANARDGTVCAGGIVVHCPFGQDLSLVPVSRQQLDHGRAIFAALLAIEKVRKEVKLDNN